MFLGSGFLYFGFKIFIRYLFNMKNVGNLDKEKIVEVVIYGIVFLRVDDGKVIYL